eukprot:12412072-Karenia_brevis.AAC.1
MGEAEQAKCLSRTGIYLCGTLEATNNEDYDGQNPPDFANFLLGLMDKKSSTSSEVNCDTVDTSDHAYCTINGIVGNFGKHQENVIESDDDSDSNIEETPLPNINLNASPNLNPDFYGVIATEEELQKRAPVNPPQIPENHVIPMPPDDRNEVGSYVIKEQKEMMDQFVCILRRRVSEDALEEGRADIVNMLRTDLPQQEALKFYAAQMQGSIMVSNTYATSDPD